MYSLGRTFGGGAKRKTKRPFKGGRPGAKYSGQGQSNSDRRYGNGQLRSSWMKGVKGCFVCGKDHLANSRHSREEVTAAIEKLKAKPPRALLTVDDLHSVVNMAIQESDEDIDHSSDGEVMWNQEDSDSAESDIAYMAASDAKAVETALA